MSSFTFISVQESAVGWEVLKDPEMSSFTVVSVQEAAVGWEVLKDPAMSSFTFVSVQEAAVGWEVFNDTAMSIASPFFSVQEVEFKCWRGRGTSGGQPWGATIQPRSFQRFVLKQIGIQENC